MTVKLLLGHGSGLEMDPLQQLFTRSNKDLHLCLYHSLGLLIRVEIQFPRQNYGSISDFLKIGSDPKKTSLDPESTPRENYVSGSEQPKKSDPYLCFESRTEHGGGDGAGVGLQLRGRGVQAGQLSAVQNRFLAG